MPGCNQTWILLSKSGLLLHTAYMYSEVVVIIRVLPDHCFPVIIDLIIFLNLEPLINSETFYFSNP